MSKGSKQFVKGKSIPSTQSSGLAPRGTPVSIKPNVPMHSNAFEGRDIEQSIKPNYKDGRYH